MVERAPRSSVVSEMPAAGRVLGVHVPVYMPMHICMKIMLFGELRDLFVASCLARTWNEAATKQTPGFLYLESDSSLDPSPLSFGFKKLPKIPSFGQHFEFRVFERDGSYDECAFKYRSSRVLHCRTS